MNNLAKYSPDQLRQAGQHLVRLQAFADHESQKAPGTGWAPIFEMLTIDKNSLVAEMGARKKPRVN
jgi:hypothetical protein